VCNVVAVVVVVYNGPGDAPILSLPMEDLGPLNTWFLRLTRVDIPNCILIGSLNQLAQLMVLSTHTHTTMLQVHLYSVHVMRPDILL